jgi:hypothetical protein
VHVNIRWAHTDPAVDDSFSRCFDRRRLLVDEPAYRLQLAHRFSYVLPEPHLLQVVRRYSPLVELGAGTGYWTHLLRGMGADVVAYDLAPVGGSRENRYHPGVHPWLDVLEGDARVLAAHSERALFLCWPPAFSALWEALHHYAGETVIYVGDHGPRTARLAGLKQRFRRLQRFPALAMDPSPGRPAELSVWRRTGQPGARTRAAQAGDTGRVCSSLTSHSRRAASASSPAAEGAWRRRSTK